MASLHNSHAIHQGGMAPRVITCNYSYTPTSEEYFDALGTYGSTVLVVGGLITVGLFILFFEQVFFTHANAHRIFRRHIFWIASVYPMMSLMSVIALVVPRANNLCTAFKVTYMSIGISHFTDLTQLMWGGEDILLAKTSSEPLNLQVGPICCCCICLPKPPITKFSLRLVILLSDQLPFTQAAYYFMVLLLLSANNITLGSVNYEDASLYMYLFNAASFLSGVYALQILTYFSRGHLEHYSYRAKSFSMKTLVLVTNMQGMIFDIMGNYNAFPCIPPFLPPNVYKQTAENSLYLLEMMVLGSYTFWHYHNQQFDHRPSRRLPREREGDQRTRSGGRGLSISSTSTQSTIVESVLDAEAGIGQLGAGDGDYGGHRNTDSRGSSVGSRGGSSSGSRGSSVASSAASRGGSSSGSRGSSFASRGGSVGSRGGTSSGSRGSSSGSREGICSSSGIRGNSVASRGGSSGGSTVGSRVSSSRYGSTASRRGGSAADSTSGSNGIGSSTYHTAASSKNGSHVSSRDGSGATRKGNNGGNFDISVTGAATSGSGASSRDGSIGNRSGGNADSRNGGGTSERSGRGLNMNESVHNDKITVVDRIDTNTESRIEKIDDRKLHTATGFPTNNPTLIIRDNQKPQRRSLESEGAYGVNTASLPLTSASRSLSSPINPTIYSHDNAPTPGLIDETDHQVNKSPFLLSHQSTNMDPWEYILHAPITTEVHPNIASVPRGGYLTDDDAGLESIPRSIIHNAENDLQVSNANNRSKDNLQNKNNQRGSITNEEHHASVDLSLMEHQDMRKENPQNDYGCESHA